MAIIRLVIASLLIGIAAILLLAGLFMLLWGFEHWLDRHLGHIASLCLSGGILIVMSGGIGWIAVRQIR